MDLFHPGFLSREAAAITEEGQVERQQIALVLAPIIIGATAHQGRSQVKDQHQQGTRMKGAVRLAHIFLAKLIEILWIDHRIRLTEG